MDFRDGGKVDEIGGNPPDLRDDSICPAMLPRLQQKGSP
jgi:hypothetical protein